MAVSVNTSKLAAFVRTFAENQATSGPNIQRAAANAGGFDAYERELLNDVWTYLERTYGGRHQVAKELNSGFDLEGELQVRAREHTMNKGDGLSELAEALESLGFKDGMEGLHEARATAIAKNLDGLAQELASFLESIVSGAEDAPLSYLAEQLQTMLAEPPEDAPTPAKLALVAAWLEEAHTTRPPTAHELEGFIVMPRIFKMLDNYKNDTSGRAFRNYAGNKVSSNLCGGLFEAGNQFDGYAGFRFYSDARVATEELDLDGEGPSSLSAEWTMDWSEVPVRESLGDVAVKVNYDLDQIREHGGSVLDYLEKVDSSRQPWQAAAMEQLLNEGSSAVTRDRLDAFVVQANIRQEYLAPESFSMGFADAFRDMTVRVNGHVSSGLFDLAEHAEHVNKPEG